MVFGSEKLLENPCQGGILAEHGIIGDDLGRITYDIPIYK